MARQGVILVAGATGNVGRQVVAQLREAGAAVRALARDPGRAALPAGVDVVRGDLTDPDHLHAALDGVESVFLLWPSLATDGAAAAVDAIKRYARRVVYLSAMAVSDDPAQRTGSLWGTVEHLIEQSGLEWTFVRPGGFATNTLGWAPQIRADGVVRDAYGAAARSLIHERDIAAVSVRALTGDGHAGRRYVLTGPQVVSQEEQVRTIGEVIGRPVRWEEIPREAARQRLVAAWGDPTFVDAALDYYASLVTQPEPVTATVEKLTGTPARTFREWVTDHADDFR